MKFQSRALAFLAVLTFAFSASAKDDPKPSGPATPAPRGQEIVPGFQDVWGGPVYKANIAMRYRLNSQPEHRALTAGEVVVSYPPESAGLGATPSYGFLNPRTRVVTWVEGPAKDVIPAATTRALPTAAPQANPAEPTPLEVMPGVMSEFNTPVYRANLAMKARLTLDPSMAQYRLQDPVMAYMPNPQNPSEPLPVVGFYNPKTRKVTWLNGLEAQQNYFNEMTQAAALQARREAAAPEEARLEALKAMPPSKSKALVVTDAPLVDHYEGRQFERVRPSANYKRPKPPSALNRFAEKVGEGVKAYVPGANQVRVKFHEMYKKAAAIPPSVWNNVKAIPAEEAALLKQFRDNPFRVSPFEQDPNNPGFGKKQLEGAPKFLRDAQKALQTKNTASDTVNGSMNNLSTQAVVWGIMLGISAYTKLTLDYPNNPVAWEEFRQTITDPIGVMSMIGFVMAYNAAYARMGGGASNPFWNVSGAMAAGTVASYSINYFANNPAVMKCGGFTSFRETGHFIRDLSACDEAFAASNLMDIAAQTVKASAAQAIVGTAAYGAIMPAWPVLSKLIYTPAAVPRFGSLSPLIITGLIMWYASEVPVQMMMAQMNEAGAKYEVLNRGTYARSIHRAESDLLHAWVRAKKSGWADPSDLSGAKNVCYDVNRVASPYYDCAQPGADFQGALDAYQGHLAHWRDHMMQSTLQSFQKWIGKVTGFRQMLAASHQFYKTAIQKIVYTRRNPNAPSNDPNRFSAVSMGLNLKPKFRAPFVISKDGDWSRVYTPELTDYLMTSLACGPEAEGREKRTILGHAGRLWSKWVTTHASPEDMIDDVKGWNTVFRPPRLTNPLYESTDTVCDNVSAPFGSDELWRWMPTSLWTPIDRIAPMKNTVNSFFVRAHGVNYRGLPDYILDNIRPGVISPEGNDTFDRWWNDYVETRNQEFEALTKTQYRKMLIKRFQPALNAKDYDWCQVKAVTAGSDLERYLGELADPGQTCGAKQTHRLARGIINNFRDEARLYFAMMMDLYVSNPDTFRPGDTRLPRKNPEAYLENIVRVPIQRVMASLAKFEKVFSSLGDPKDIKAAYEELKAEYATFVDLMLPQDLTLDPNDKKAQFQYEWMLKLLNAITADLGGLEAYMQYATMGSQTDLG